MSRRQAIAQLLKAAGADITDSELYSRHPAASLLEHGSYAYMFRYAFEAPPSEQYNMNGPLYTAIAIERHSLRTYFVEKDALQHALEDSNQGVIVYRERNGLSFGRGSPELQEVDELESFLFRMLVLEYILGSRYEFLSTGPIQPERYNFTARASFVDFSNYFDIFEPQLFTTGWVHMLQSESSRVVIKSDNFRELRAIRETLVDKEICTAISDSYSWSRLPVAPLRRIPFDLVGALEAGLE